MSARHQATSAWSRRYLEVGDDHDDERVGSETAGVGLVHSELLEVVLDQQGERLHRRLLVQVSLHVRKENTGTQVVCTGRKTGVSFTGGSSGGHALQNK